MIYNLSIKAIETSLPKNSFKISSLKKKNPSWDIKKIIAKTGIEKIWYTKKNQTALDLAFELSIFNKFVLCVMIICVQCSAHLNT